MTALLRPATATRQIQLSDLSFTDIYLRLDGQGLPHYRGGDTGVMNAPDVELPECYFTDAEALSQHLRDNFVGNEAAVDYDGMRLRATRLLTAKGEEWAALRRLHDFPPQLEQLGFIPQLAPVLEDMGRRSGLILVCGASGQGKTTTVSSLLMRYLGVYGGIGFTLEDPVEFDMEGRCGKNGYCYQTEIKQEDEWGLMLKRALRWHPRYIMVGEIRTPEAANQVLRAAVSGHTVLATLHAGNMDEALEALLQLAEQDLGARAALLLAAGLTGVVYQTFAPSGLFGQFMITEADNSGSAIRTMIRERRIGQTRTVADLQMAKLIQTGKIF